jgi:hypothetical protein
MTMRAWAMETTLSCVEMRFISTILTEMETKALLVKAGSLRESGARLFAKGSFLFGGEVETVGRSVSVRSGRCGDLR